VTALIWINDITSFQSQYHHEMIRTLSQPKYAFIKQFVNGDKIQYTKSVNLCQAMLVFNSVFLWHITWWC